MPLDAREMACFLMLPEVFTQNMAGCKNEQEYLSINIYIYIHFDDIGWLLKFLFPELGPNTAIPMGPAS